MIRDHRPYWLFRLAAAWRDWRTAHFLRPHFASLGARAVIADPKHVELTGANIAAGDDLHVIASADMKVRLTAWPPPDRSAEIRIGDAVLLIGGTRILAAHRIVIGDGSMLAAGVTVTDSDWHGLYDRVAPPEPRTVTIGRNVWIGDGAFIGKGVTIGDNAVIGARAVVVKDIPPDCVAAGVPARVVKRLDPDAPRRTRLDLTADPDALEEWTRAMHRQRLSGNSTPGWLRAALFPKRGD